MKIETDKNSVIVIAILTGGLILSLVIGGAYYFSFAKAKAAFAAGLSEVPDSSQGTHYGK